MGFIDTYLTLLHPPTVHFVIVAYLLSFLATLLGNVLQIVSVIQNQDREVKINFLERLSWVSFLSGFALYPIVGIFGLIDAGSLQTAINSDLLAFKIQLSIFILVFSLMLMTFGLIVKNHFEAKLLGTRSLIAAIYQLFVFILAILVMVVAASGGKYVYGKSAFETFGIGFLIPETIAQPNENTRYVGILSVFYSYVSSIILTILFLALLLISYIKMGDQE